MYPMNFTNVGEEQTVSGEQNFRNRRPYSPGLFSPTQEFQVVPDSIPRTPGDSRTAHQMVPGTTLLTVPTTNMWGGFDGSNNWKDESFISSTPMSDMNQRQQNANIAALDHKWKKFVLGWIWFILSLILVIGWCSVTFPFHDIVCWPQHNVLLFVVILLITFLVSIIVKLFIDETSRRLGHFDNQKEDKRRPTDTVRQKLNFDQNIQHIRDNVKIVPVTSPSPLQVNRSEDQVKRTFSGSNDDVLADFLRYFENIATLNAWNEERKDLHKRAYPSHQELVQENSIRSFLDACGESEEFRMFIRQTKPKTLQEDVSSAMQEECIRINEGNVNKKATEIFLSDSRPMLRPLDTRFITVSGGDLKVLGTAVMTLSFDEFCVQFQIIVGGVRNNLLGEDFIQSFRCQWDWDSLSLEISSRNIPFHEQNECARSSRVVSLETVTVPAKHEIFVRSGITRKVSTSSADINGVLSPDRNFMTKYGLALARVLVNASQGMVYARLFNPNSTDIILYKGTHIAVFVPLLNIGNSVEVEDENEDVCHIVEHGNSSDKILPQYMEKMYQSGIQNLSNKEADEFKRVLLQNCSVFADPDGQTGPTLLGMHEIKLEKQIPIKEPPRRVPLFKRKIIKEEIEKLEKKGVIEKSCSPWSAPIVLVQKNDSSWRLCVYYRKHETQFLGHIVSSNGVKTDPKKKAVSKMKTPENVKELRSFLGLVSYYRKFIKNFSLIAKSLFELTKPRLSVTRNWSEECDMAFHTLKDKLVTSPILSHPDVNGGEFILDTDGSYVSIGCMLSQIQQGQEHVIAYGNGQISRWIQQISAYDVKIVHRPGKKHSNAEALSRMKVKEQDFCTQCKLPWDYEFEAPPKQDEIEEPIVICTSK
ncbi:unnamed protein product [Mytilus coruscus]|uniref:Reverse transcriptase/retrotransposon-derived protein RNase H-like domain-containing protein n=1 Tax=Mytilus coruscus TaxID=42192 RepID=A0A6J8BIP4_MYTCO|nr:unnamed protein product [Mytilus coruscus]